MDWTQRAVCRDADPEAFFPAGEIGGRRTRELAREVAHTYCARCPVLAQCDQRARGARSTMGVWAGSWWAYRTPPTPLIAAAYDLGRPRSSRAG